MGQLGSAQSGQETNIDKVQPELRKDTILEYNMKDDGIAERKTITKQIASTKTSDSDTDISTKNITRSTMKLSKKHHQLMKANITYFKPCTGLEEEEMDERLGGQHTRIATE